MITTIFISLAVNAVILTVALIFILRHVDRRVQAPPVFDEIKKEINSLIVEMNRTTDQNIGIIEDRVKQIQGLMEQADKKIKLLEKKDEQLLESKVTYAHLSKNKPLEIIPFSNGSENPDLKEPDAENNKDEKKKSDKYKEEKVISLQEQVLDLYRKGFSSGIIASKLNAAIGEVELIISLKGLQ